MNRNLAGLIFSVAFICLTVLAAFILYRVFKLSSEAVRKFIHITVSNWVFIVAYAFDSFFYAIIGPVLFIFVNAVFVYGGFGRYLGMGDRKRDNGLIYFPLSLSILVALFWYGRITDLNMIMAMLIMGWGDGLAALIGKKIGKHKYKAFGATKSLEGTFVMFLVSFIIAMLCKESIPSSLVIALAAAFLEAITPLGFDNITVPLLSAALGALL